MKKRFSFGLGAVVGLLLLVLSFLFLSPDQSYSQSDFQFHHDGQRVSGSLILPRDAKNEPRDCVVFVHGDGAMDREGLGYFAPYFSHFAERGMCVLSWDKPGVGASEGNWLSFDMAARAELVKAAINALRAQSRFDVRSVGLMGFSQAGWVMPKIAAKENDIHFYIFVSPAVNWQRQSQFMSALRERDLGAEAIAARRASGAPVDALLAANEPYAAFEALATSRDDVDGNAFSKDRWDFVRANMHADLTADLQKIGDAPVLLLLGARDGQVDAEESRKVFQEKLKADQLKVGWFDEAGHSLIHVDEQKPMDEWDGLVLLTKVMIGGKSAFAPGVWAAIDEFLAAQNSSTD